MLSLNKTILKGLQKNINVNHPTLPRLNLMPATYCCAGSKERIKNAKTRVKQAWILGISVNVNGISSKVNSCVADF